MYKILIKQPHTRRTLFEPYMVDKVVEESPPASEEVELVSPTSLEALEQIEYSTDDLVELAEKYKEILSKYTTEQIKVIEELDVDLLVSVTDN